MKKPKIIEMIKEQAAKESASEWRPPRKVGVYRGSELGDCPRAIQYAIRGYASYPINAELALLFSDGHLHHNDLRSRLKSVGVVTNIEYSTAKVYEGELPTVTITGTTDGIFEGEFVFDIKTINFFSFKKLTEEYLYQEYPHYIDQIQAYLELFDKEWGFLLFKCKMTSALKIFWIHRDPERFKKILNKLTQITIITNNGGWIKRPFSKSSKECKWCPYRMHCWQKAPEQREW